MFERGLTLLRVRGIPVRVHLSLLLFLPYLAFVATRQYRWLAGVLGVGPEELRVPAWAWGGVLAVGTFVAVLAHELAHCWVALANGARVRSISLMMLGGVSTVEGELPPAKEAWMAFAGPLASLVIAAACFAAHRLLPLPADVAVAAFAGGVTNAFLGAFNLLPAFPMDGGRVVRGLLATRLGVARATIFAARLGQGMAALFAAWAILTYNPLLVLVAWFVWAGASAERERARAGGHAAS
jgi:Zn-dependent protease